MLLAHRARRLVAPRRRQATLCAALAIIAALVSLGAAPSSARAASRMKAIRYHKPTAGSDIDTGGAWLVVNAPLPVVRKVLQRHRKYVHILPRLEQSRVVSRKGKQTDVYMRAPILNGVAHLWAVIRFSAPRTVGKWEMIVGRMVKGNLEDYHGVWKMYPCGPERTLLKMEIFADVKIPMPASMISPELEWLSDFAVSAVRDRAECAYRSSRRGMAPAAGAKPASPTAPPTAPKAPAEPADPAQPGAPPPTPTPPQAGPAGSSTPKSEPGPAGAPAADAPPSRPR